MLRVKCFRCQAMYAASGGHIRKIFFYASIMIVITGINIFAVPQVVHLFLDPLLAQIHA